MERYLLFSFYGFLWFDFHNYDDFILEESGLKLSRSICSYEMYASHWKANQCFESVPINVFLSICCVYVWRVCTFSAKCLDTYEVRLIFICIIFNAILAIIILFLFRFPFNAFIFLAIFFSVYLCISWLFKQNTYNGGIHFWFAYIWFLIDQWCVCEFRVNVFVEEKSDSNENTYRHLIQCNPGADMVGVYCYSKGWLFLCFAKRLSLSFSLIFLLFPSIIFFSAFECVYFCFVWIYYLELCRCYCWVFD